jgi:DNA-binding response OmpR family regulator
LVSAVEQIEALARANEDLRRENKRLRDIIAGAADIPTEWGLTYGEARIARALMNAKGRVVTHARLLFLARVPGRIEPNKNGIEVRVHHLRKKLAPFGLRIRAIRHEGYALVPT